MPLQTLFLRLVVRSIGAGSRAAVSLFAPGGVCLVDIEAERCSGSLFDLFRSSCSGVAQ